MDSCEDGLLLGVRLRWTSNSWPRLTECFQSIALQWIPCAFLWLLAPFHILHLRSQKCIRQNSTKRWVFQSKMLCTFIVLVHHFLEMPKAFGDLNLPRLEHLSPLIWIITLSLQLYVVHLEELHQRIRSPVLFVFWILVAMSGLIPIYNDIMHEMYTWNKVKFIFYCIKLCVSSVCGFLNCFIGGNTKEHKGHNPELSASLFSWLTFSWVNSLIFREDKKPLKEEEVYRLHPRDSTKRVVTKFLKKWEDANNEKNRWRNKNGQDWPMPLLGDRATFLIALLKCYWSEVVKCQWGFVVFVIMNIFSPIMLGWLIYFTRDPSEPTWHGYIYVLAFLTTKILGIVFNAVAKFLNNCLSLRVHSTAIAVVFRKSLIMSSGARKESATGEIVNLMSVDAGHLDEMVKWSHLMWVCALFLGVGVYLLYTIVGLAVLSGLGFVLGMFFINFFVWHRMRIYEEQIMTMKDERLKVLSEVLNGIKVIKLSGWEPLFMRKIEKIREKELQLLTKYALLDGVGSFAWLAAMFWMLYFMVVTFVLTDESHHLSARVSFLTMNYIDIVQFAINILPKLVNSWIMAASSVGRMDKFLNMENLNPSNLSRDSTDKFAARITDGNFTWEISRPLTLKRINLSILPGQLVAIVGPVGCGKSSLLCAMLGEMHNVNGHVNLSSSVAYVPQQAWIQNNTLRENILFGQLYDPELYQEVISACALQPDLAALPAGDLTEIGEKGINLSGGQKQRVSLARAVYSQADIYLLDDPLSAVDSHVGQHIFQHVVSRTGLLKNKTRILVTHGTQWLSYVDNIVVMDGGTIAEMGTYEQLMEDKGMFAQFLSEYGASQTEELGSAHPLETDEKNVSSLMKQEVATDSKSPSQCDLRQRTQGRQGQQSERSKHENTMKSESDEQAENFGRLTTDETVGEIKVRWTVYWEVMKGMGVGPACAVLLLLLSYHILFNLTNIWIAKWTDDVELNNFTAMPANSSARKQKNIYYISVYTGLGVFQTLLVTTYSIYLQMRRVAASRKLHSELLNSIMRAPISFFYATPIGRILNRFSGDVDIVDNDIVFDAEIVIDNALRLVGTAVVISYTVPFFFTIVVPIAVLVYSVQKVYSRVSCQLFHMASRNKSPVFAHFSETLSGACVIRAYQAQERFIADSECKIGNFQKAVLASIAVTRWLETRLDMLNCVIFAVVSTFAVVMRDELSPGLVGLIITHALRASAELNAGAVVFGDLENHVISVERLREYSVLNSEASWLASTCQIVDDHWPSCGKILFINYSTRYRENLALVLKELNFTISSGEKVGIVGRTGAGKSSMVLSLFRLIEAAGGKIIIDGVDISKIGLHILRRKITILPQDPVLFAGSLRMNIDPFGEKCEKELWAALEYAHLKSFVENLPHKLDHEVGEGGENLSMGQRQLVCLARTLLRKTKILILDEATAAVDMETDDLIQKTIRKEFSGCTVLTIAHRLNTIMDYDRVLVLDNGELIEFDTPHKLMSDPTSSLFAMARHATVNLQYDES